MKTTIITNSLKEIKTVAAFYGIEVKSSEIAVSFPYRFENENVAWELDEEITFEDFQAMRRQQHYERVWGANDDNLIDH